MGDVGVISGTGSELIAAASWREFAATDGTVFHTRPFLLAWWNDRLAKNPASRLAAAEIVDGERVIGACAVELASDTVSFAGGSDVVDYMGPITAAGREKEVAAALVGWIFEELAWERAHFAGLVGDDPTTQALVLEITRRAPSAIVGVYDQAPQIKRAEGGYLALLNSKRRADVLRKRNRLTENVGELDLVVSTRETVLESLERLLAWKAAAGAATRDFVAEYGGFMRALVTDLAAVDACHVAELCASGHPLAAAIVFRHRNTDYLYNMSYDMELTAGAQSGLAPGVVLVSLLAERSLGEGFRFDFLKGAQDYKLRLGGVPVDLIGITVAR